MSIESVRKRLAEATPGPWRSHPNPAYGGPLEKAPPPHYIRTADSADSGPGDPWGSEGAVVSVEGDECGGVWNKADADLIAHAPTDLRLLLDVVEATSAFLDAGTQQTERDLWSALDALHGSD